MPQLTKTQSRQDSHKIAAELFALQPAYEAMNDKRDALKVKLRTFGPQEYIFDGGVVKVGEPEVRTFKGQTFVLNLDGFANLPPADRKNLIDKGLVKIEDIYSRNAVAKVETTLT